jgi:uncharacterized protein YdaU (DUF1376 family)
MSRADTWMPLYIGDSLADTMSLEAREHGAYLLLIMHYWRNGPLPSDDRSLAGIARVDRKTWIGDTGPIVRQFFNEQDGKLHHKRIDKERAEAQTIADVKRAAAKARWSKGKEATVNGSGGGGPPDACADPHADAYASQVDARCSSPLPSPSQIQRKKESFPSERCLKNSAYTADFEEWWAEYPARPHDNKATAAQAYAKACKAVSAGFLLEQLRAYRFNDDPQFRRMAATWLNRRSWEDRQSKPALNLKSGMSWMFNEDGSMRPPEDFMN